MANMHLFLQYTSTAYILLAGAALGAAGLLWFGATVHYAVTFYADWYRQLFHNRPPED